MNRFGCVPINLYLDTQFAAHCFKCLYDIENYLGSYLRNFLKCNGILVSQVYKIHLA
jgi:hypothetical protein